MNQIVYVVMDTELACIYGVYNSEADAIKVATWINDKNVTVTPVLVDARPIVDNGNCENPDEVHDEVDAIYKWMEADGSEVYNLDDYIETEDDTEDEYEEEDYEDEDEDEEEGEDEYSESEVQRLLRWIFNE